MLGMGDIVGLVEAAQSAVDEEEARRQQEKLAKGKFDLDDFRKQIVQMKKMGSMRDLMSKIPGLNQMPHGSLGGIDADEEIKRIQGIIDSMTPGRAARSRPDRHLAAPADRRRQRRRPGRRLGAGQAVRRHGRDRQADGPDEHAGQDQGALTGLGRAAAINPAAQIMAPKVGTGKRLSPKEREKLRKQREKEERRRRREERESAPA